MIYSLLLNQKNTNNYYVGGEFFDMITLGVNTHIVQRKKAKHKKSGFIRHKM